MSLLWRTGRVFAALLALGAPAAAQVAAGAPVEIAKGQKVWVTASDGVAHDGRVVGVSAASIDVSTPDGIASWAWADVRMVETPDPIRNGIRNGAIAGAITGAAMGMMIGHGLRCRSNCGEDYSVARDIAGGALIGGVFGTGYGVAFGAVIDWLVHQRRTVYSSGRAAARAQLIPAYARDGARVELTVVWP